MLISCRLLRKWNVGGYLRLCPVVEVAEGNGKGFYDYGTQRYLLGPESATLWMQLPKKKTETLFWSKCEASLIFREKWKCCSSPCLWQPYKLQFSAFSTFCCCCYTTHYIERVGMGIWVCDPYLQICMYVCMCTGCHMPTGSTNICHRKAICLSWPESLNRLSVMTIESAPSCNAMHCIITVPQLTISGVDGSVQSRKNYGNRMRIPGTWWRRMAAIRMDQRTRK